MKQDVLRRCAQTLNSLCSQDRQRLLSRLPMQQARDLERTLAELQGDGESRAGEAMHVDPGCGIVTSPVGEERLGAAKAAHAQPLHEAATRSRLRAEHLRHTLARHWRKLRAALAAALSR